jgi:hypothetical protein
MAADHVQTFFVLHGDINRDRAVNGSDFAILAGNFGKTGMTYAQGDVNGDGSVNGSDFAILAGNFGNTLPATAPAVVATTQSATAKADPVITADPAPAPVSPPAAAAPVKRRAAPAPRPRVTPPLPRRVLRK